jgi:hypothetical protein
VGVVEDDRQGLAGVVEAEGLFDEAAFAFEGGAFELDAAGVAEDFDGVGIGVQVGAFLTTIDLPWSSQARGILHGSPDVEGIMSAESPD